jgi:hypothetical protein
MKRLRGGQAAGPIPSTNIFSVTNILLFFWGCFNLYSLLRYWHCLGITVGLAITGVVLALHGMIYLAIQAIFQAQQMLRQEISIVSLLFTYSTARNYSGIFVLSIVILIFLTIGVSIPCYPSRS